MIAEWTDEQNNATKRLYRKKILNYKKIKIKNIQ